MALLSTTVLDEVRQTNYLKERYISASIPLQVWDQFADAGVKIIEDKANAGVTFTEPVFELLDPQPTALPATSDVEPKTFVDGTASVTMYEYGNAVDLPRFLEWTSYTDLYGATASRLGTNMAETREILARYAYLQGSRVFYPTGAAARTDIVYTTSGHEISFDNFMQLKIQAESIGMPAFDDGTYVTVVHPSALYDLSQDDLWQNVAVYTDPKMIWDGTAASLMAGAKFIGEQGRLAGVRICVSRFGKVYYSGGTLPQAATTLVAAASAGDTSFDVTTNTGIADGDWLTVGTLDTADTEQVQVSIDTDTCTIINGFGNAEDNLGFKFDHDILSAITEATQVIAVPIIGPDSITKVVSKYTGADGIIDIHEKETNIGGRFNTFGWLGWWGYAVRQERYLIRGELAVTKKTPGYVEKV